MKIKWKKGMVGINKHGGYKREFFDGYIAEEVFGVSKCGRGWRGTHLPTGMFVCDAPTAANAKEICEAFLEVATVEWWKAITAEIASNPSGGYTDVMEKCARLRRELKKGN